MLVTGRRFRLANSPVPDVVRTFTVNYSNVSIGQAVASNSIDADLTNSTLTRVDDWLISSSLSVAKTNLLSRDMEVKTAIKDFGFVILRADIITNKCIYFYADFRGSNGYMGIFLGNVSDSFASFTPDSLGHQYLFDTANARSYLGYTDDATDHFTFGVEGFEIYLKDKNDHEVLRFTNLTHVKRGYAEIKVLDTSSAHGEIKGFTIKQFANKTLFSNTDTNVIDLRDIGIKPLKTTGSMNVSSPYILNVADASGFAVGHQIVVETGGEATTNGFAAATRGALAVGGQWPQLNYTNKAAMDADTSHEHGTLAYLQDTRLNYSFVTNDGTPYWNKVQYPANINGTPHEGNYYQAYTIGKSLRGIITNISGNTITLDTPCFVSTANADVWLDITPILHPIAATGSSIPLVLKLAEGNYCISETISFINCVGWTLQGAGKNLTKIRSPKGCPSARITIPNQSTYFKVYDLTLEGNGRKNGYGFQWWNAGVAGDTSKISINGPTDTSDFFRGIQVSGQYAHIKNVKVIDCFTAAIEVFGSNSIIEYCDVIHTTGIMHYMAWQIVAAGGAQNVLFSNLTFYCPELISTFESFGSTNITFDGLIATNAKLSSNSSENMNIRNATLTYTPLCLPTHLYFGEPLININRNAYSQGSGGLVENIDFIVQGYFDVFNHLCSGVNVNENNANVTVRNCSYTIDSSIRELTDTTRLNGFNSTGHNTLFDGLTIHGYNYGESLAEESHNAGDYNIHSLYGEVKNCIADSLLTSNLVTKTNNTVLSEHVYLRLMYITGITVNADTTSIEINWDDIVHADYYTVDKHPTGLGSDTGWVNVYSGSVSSFTDTGLTPSTTYYYRVIGKASSYPTYEYFKFAADTAAP